MNAPSGFGRRNAASPRPVVASGAAEAPAFEASPHAWVLESEKDLIPRPPFAAVGILIVLTLIYLGEQAFGFEPGATQSYRSLVAFGAASGDLVMRDGQWWRALTAILLHGGWEHLIGNGVALLIAGVLLEKSLGRVWFAAIFVLGGLAGSIASLSSNPPAVISVGASGAIMALLVPSLIEAFGNETAYTPRYARRMAMTMTVSALIPTSGHVDYTAHAGGALAGGILGYALLFAIPELHASAKGRLFAGGVVIAGLIAAVVSFALAATHYADYAARNAALMPDGQLAKVEIGGAKGVSDADDDLSTKLLNQYPGDPRAHLLRAAVLLHDRQIYAAEDELRAGLADRDVLNRDLPPGTEAYMHGLLAGVLMAEGRREEARTEAQPVCAGGQFSTTTSRLRDALRKEGACDAQADAKPN